VSRGDIARGTVAASLRHGLATAGSALGATMVGTDVAAVVSTAATRPPSNEEPDR